MADDDERIAKKAHELWEAEGRPHGRDREHWDAAKEIIAIQDSGKATLLARDTGAKEPVEEKSIVVDNEGEAPNLTDTGEHDLTSTAREPAVTRPTATAAAEAAGWSMNPKAPAAAKPASAPANPTASSTTRAVPKQVARAPDSSRSEIIDASPKKRKGKASKA